MVAKVVIFRFHGYSQLRDTLKIWRTNNMKNLQGWTFIFCLQHMGLERYEPGSPHRENQVVLLSYKALAEDELCCFTLHVECHHNGKLTRQTIGTFGFVLCTLWFLVELYRNDIKFYVILSLAKAFTWLSISAKP